MNCRTSVPTATGNLVTTLAKHYGGCGAGPCWSARFGSRQSCFLCNYLWCYSVGTGGNMAVTLYGQVGKGKARRPGNQALCETDRKTVASLVSVESAASVASVTADS